MARKDKAKARARLTNAGLASFEPPPEVEFVWDEEIPGFGLRTRQRADVRDWRWVYRYRHKSGRQVTLTGASPLAWPPPQARTWAKEQAKRAHTSDDPWESTQRRRAELVAEKAKPTVEALWREWRAAEGALKKSANGDEALWNNHIKARLGRRKAASITQADLIKLRDDLSANPIVANRCLSLVSRMFTKAIEWGYRAGCAPEHPVRGVKRNPENKVEFFFSDDEIARLLDAADKDASKAKGLVIRMLAITGARLGEVLTARWDQLTEHEDGSALWIVEASNTKTSKTVARVLPADFVARLNDWRPLSLGLQAGDEPITEPNPRLWIFPSETEPEKHMGRNINDGWQRIKKRAGVKRGRIHDLRHTVATVLTEETGSLEAAFHQLGHATMLTTRRYAHLTARARRQASDIVAERIRKAEAKARTAGAGEQ